MEDCDFPAQDPVSSLFVQLRHKAMAVIQTTNGGHISFKAVNDKLLELSGFKKNEMLSKNPIDLWVDAPILQQTQKINLLKQHRYIKTEAAVYMAKKQKMIVELELHPIPSPCESLQLLFLEPITARKWIQHQMSRQPVLVSGILSPEFVIELFDPYFDSIIDPKIHYEHLSVFDLISELDHSTIRKIKTDNIKKKIAQTVVLRTARLKDGVELDLKITVCPFFNGSGQVIHYAFLITELSTAKDTNPPDIKLKILMAQRGISAQALAEATGMTIQTISKLRTGKITKPQKLTAQLIAAELGVEISDIWPEIGK